MELLGQQLSSSGWVPHWDVPFLTLVRERPAPGNGQSASASFGGVWEWMNCWIKRVITRVYTHVLGAFAELRKTTIRFVVRLPVRPSVCEHGTTWSPLVGLCWDLIFENFSKYVRLIQATLTSDRNNGYFTWRLVYIFDHISLNSSWNEKRFR